MNSSLLLLAVIQVIFAGIVSVYFFNLMRTQQHHRVNIDRESSREMERLRRLRAISLTEPLAEKTRPASMRDIVGQEDGLRALRAALFGPHPQHVLIYGPPGVGKTAAARVVLEEAKRSMGSPFAADAVFWEIDATTARFDERGIADPLIGSVHDPIYQGAGAMGVAGIPQPKPGAVTKAHGGVLFIDEIGELHPIQMNKLLKVLEDRRVYLESAYYNPDDTNIPLHIHDIFQQGLPADFRLVGATTRSPEELPPAVRSRCVEVFFRPLVPEEIGVIVERAAEKLNMPITPDAVEVVKRHATNGREAVNVVQIAAGITLTDGRGQIVASDMEWVVHSSHIAPRPERKVPAQPQVGVVNGLAVYGPSTGLLLEVEATATLATVPGRGKVSITGVVEEEEIGGSGRVLKRRSMARSSVDNVITALRRMLPVNLLDYDVHVNFPGGIPVDGPSAGVSMAVAIYSAITGLKVDNLVAMTGEISIYGTVRPVGGVPEKVKAAQEAGAKKVLIPAENDQLRLHEDSDLRVIPITRIEEALAEALGVATLPEPLARSVTAPVSAPGAVAQGSI
ncbi:ATP-dependent protease LonB [Sulfoacidibacillus thermotolerans]|uniref:endopeptidase La n=1 Tax=Sulfoacidibacillus thermotolerans TaxID=1765684 RepID=A0A2U3DC36_SULT2|nr:ATP-dependent protease LonB [Sulfoacidibacillus thermotolerans]PWI58857.1 ATP-dependent protease LonB [Sulfoacidibacillus thermotolerans]